MAIDSCMNTIDECTHVAKDAMPKSGDWQY